MFLDPSQEDSIQFNSLINLKMKSSYEGLNECRSISDPIYKSISFKQPIWNVIDTPIYQRLRNIK